MCAQQEPCHHDHCGANPKLSQRLIFSIPIGELDPVRTSCPSFSMHLHCCWSGCMKADDICLLCTGTIPLSWGESTAFSALQQLWLDSNQLTGFLPGSWPATLQILNVTANKFTGRLPAGLAQQQQLQWAAMFQNNITGALPAEWGSPASFPQLWILDCSLQHISGTLPSTWGGSHAFQQLESLYLDDTAISGTLPESWASVGAFLNSLNLRSLTACLQAHCLRVGGPP